MQYDPFVFARVEPILTHGNAGNVVKSVVKNLQWITITSGHHTHQSLHSSYVKLVILI